MYDQEVFLRQAQQALKHIKAAAPAMLAVKHIAAVEQARRAMPPPSVMKSIAVHARAIRGFRPPPSPVVGEMRTLSAAIDRPST